MGIKLRVVIVLISMIIVSMAFGETVNWTGAADNNWDNPANWSTGSVPGEGDDVTIPVGSPECNGGGNSIYVNSVTNNGTMNLGYTNFYISSFTNNGQINADPAESGAWVNIEKPLFGGGDLSFINNGNIEMGENDMIKVEGGGSSTFENHGKMVGDNVEINVNEFLNADSLKGTSIEIRAGSTAWNTGDIRTKDAAYYGLKGGDIHIYGPNCVMVNEGHIKAGRGGEGDRGGDVIFNVKNVGNSGLIEGGTGGTGANGGSVYVNCDSYLDNDCGDIWAGYPGGGGRYLDSPVGGVLEIFSDSVYAGGYGAELFSDASLIIAGRKLIFAISAMWGVQGYYDFVKCYTTSDGVLDLSETHVSNAFYSTGTIDFYTESLIAPVEGLDFICNSTPTVNSTDLTFIRGKFEGFYNQFAFNGETDTFQVLMQNQSMTDQVLDYSIHSTRGWVSPCSGSSSSLDPFKLDSVDIIYTVPTGLLDETTDTVFLVITIGGTYADTGYAFITSDSALVLSIDDKDSPKPVTTVLSCYPNPFNSAMRISTVPNADIAIYDIEGRLVETGTAKGGEFVWAASEAAAGVYLVRATCGDGVSVTKRVVYLK